MDIKCCSVGALATNCYLVKIDNKCGFAVDPGGNGAQLLTTIREMDLDLRYILLTHGHFDHIGAVSLLVKNTGAKVVIHRNDAEMLVDSAANLSLFFQDGLTTVPADIILEGDQDLTLSDGTVIQVIETPGHTPGGVTYVLDGTAFSGDTLFAGSIGRYDFPGSSFKELQASLKKLCCLPDNTVVCPGHGPKTDIAREKKSNPFIDGIHQDCL
ncbi:MAG: MBL fold metallo-hydrolase [Limnochordia bacterium]|jgi:hydroxyacylglutathione hydrolase|nr:MBL fold metallo-hydrolase [Limnochordia bacterium]